MLALSHQSEYIGTKISSTTEECLSQNQRIVLHHFNNYTTASRVCILKIVLLGQLLFLNLQMREIPKSSEQVRRNRYNFISGKSSEIIKHFASNG